MRIAIISDTHSLLRPEVEEAISGCDRILHGGDIASKDLYERLNDLAPCIFVRGNADREWAEDLPEDIEFERFQTVNVFSLMLKGRGYRVF